MNLAETLRGTEQVNQLRQLACQRILARTLPPITWLDLFLTERCNLRCDYCFVASKRYQQMPWEVARKSVDFLMRESRDSPEVHITLFGGEPLLAFPLMVKVAEYAVERACAVGKEVTFSCTTNGTLLTEKHVEFAQRYGFLYLLSIDGTPESHDMHRRFGNGKGSYRVVEKKLALLKRLQQWIGSRLTVNPDNVHELSTGIRSLFGKGVNQFLISVNPDVPWNEEQLQTFSRQMEQVWHFYIEMKRKGAPIRIVEFEESLDERRGKCRGVWGCDAGRTRVSIAVDGKIYPCARFVSTYEGMNGRFCLGDVERGLVGYQERIALFQAEMKVYKQCRRCELADFCTGGCPASNFYMNGDLFAPTPVECQYTKTIVNILHKNGCTGPQE